MSKLTKKGLKGICYKFISNRIRYQQMEELNIINDVFPENNFEMVEIQIKSEDEGI